MYWIPTIVTVKRCLKYTYGPYFFSWIYLNISVEDAFDYLANMRLGLYNYLDNVKARKLQQFWCILMFQRALVL